MWKSFYAQQRERELGNSQANYRQNYMRDNDKDFNGYHRHGGRELRDKSPSKSP
jgi:hypothetical protein